MRYCSHYELVHSVTRNCSRPAHTPAELLPATYVNAVPLSTHDDTTYSRRQTYVSSDRTSTFAIVMYDNLAAVRALFSLGVPVQVGFNAGDGQRYLNIPVNSLQQVNVYHIDGMYV